MKNGLIILGLVLVMTIPYLAISGEIDSKCGMVPAESQTKFYVTIEGKKIPTNSLRCAYEIAFMQYKASFQEREKIPLIEAMDFESREMFNALQGFYVVNTDIVPKGSMEPYILGFSNIERANNFWKANNKPGVRVVNFETATLDVVNQLRMEGKLPPAGEAPQEQIDIILKRKK